MKSMQQDLKMLCFTCGFIMLACLPDMINMFPYYIFNELYKQYMYIYMYVCEV